MAIKCAIRSTPPLLESFCDLKWRLFPQDAHDFNKSLQVARESESLQGEVLEEVYVFGSMGGRFDHVAAMLATMYEHVDTLNMVIVTPFNTMWLLGAGKHTMLMDDVIQGAELHY